MVLETLEYSNADEIVLPEEVFETTLSVFREARDEIDCDDNAENADVSNSDDDFSVVHADSVAFLSLRRSRWRNICPPIRMVLKQ